MEQPNWFKSTLSNGEGGCVEVAFMTEGVWTRDSKDPDGPVLRFTHREWDLFVRGAKAGEFDLR